VAQRCYVPATVEVRPIQPSEYEAAGALVLAAYEALPGQDIGPYAQELVDVAARAATAEVLVAFDEGELAGCVTFVPDFSNPWAEGLCEGEAAIRMLGVDPDSQGRGAGRALVEACIDEARRLGRRALVLHSTTWMVTAHRLYLRLGFVRDPGRDWWPQPEVRLLAFRLNLVVSDSSSADPVSGSDPGIADGQPGQQPTAQAQQAGDPKPGMKSGGERAGGEGRASA
jgi:GNAT superfamily N-acetyltransferase